MRYIIIIMKRISRIPSCFGVRAVLRCYPLSLPLMRWVLFVEVVDGDGVVGNVRLCVRDMRLAKIEC